MVWMGGVARHFLPLPKMPWLLLLLCASPFITKSNFYRDNHIIYRWVYYVLRKEMACRWTKSQEQWRSSQTMVSNYNFLFYKKEMASVRHWENYFNFLRYVLLKERNMLLTLRHEAKRQGVPMPSPTRLHKVRNIEHQCSAALLLSGEGWVTGIPGSTTSHNPDSKCKAN